MQKRDLVPDTPGNTPGYWCTWGLQNYLADTRAQSNTFGVSGHSMIANMLTEENLKRHILDTGFLSAIRRDLHILYQSPTSNTIYTALNFSKKDSSGNIEERTLTAPERPMTC